MKIALRHAVMLVLVLIASALGPLSRAADSAAPTFVGTWQGTLDAGASKLRIVFNIQGADGGLAGTMDSPDQRAFGLKLDTVKQDGGNVTAELKVIGGVYNGTFSADGTQIIGKWNQSGYSLPLTLQRGEKTAGTLAHPKAPGPFAAMILITSPVLAFAGALDMQTPPRQSFPAIEPR